MVDAVLDELDTVFEGMYASSGRTSVPPEALLKATVLMTMYSIRSERAFCERLNYDLLFKWFLDMRIDQPAFDPTTFTKHRARLLEHDVADEFFAAVVGQAKLRRCVSSDHFSVDGTSLKTWASTRASNPKTAHPRRRRRAATPRRTGKARSAPTSPTPRPPTPRHGCIAKASTPPPRCVSPGTC